MHKEDTIIYATYQVIARRRDVSGIWKRSMVTGTGMRRVGERASFSNV